MDSAQSRSLIRETFTQPFDKRRFQHFIRNLLNHINESKGKHWNKTYVKDAFKPKINRFERLGTYTEPTGEKLDILIVHLERESSLERARTSLRNFVADYMTTGHGQDKSAVLAAFVSPNESDWRFSFIKLEYETAADDSGNVKVSEKLSPARRYSFLVGANEHSHTAQKQFLQLLENDERDPALSEIEEAFSIERVTEEFFNEYDGLYRNLKTAIDDLVSTNPCVREDFERKRVDTVNFAKKLLGQIVFLYFLQKKGWFGVERDGKWGTGPKNYLRILFQNRQQIGAFTKSGGSNVNFFNDVLEPLFYEALAKGDREDHYYGHFHCKIPFLNGGLFDPMNEYDWLHTNILLPDELFSNQVLTKDGVVGSGILDVFDRYNFTVNESEPLEKEVAVDPEMLGKVFERLLDAKERKSKGSFYTPREIVHYMCRQSLLSYLEKELGSTDAGGGGGTPVPRVSAPDIEALLRLGEQAADFELARLDKQTGSTPRRLKAIEANAHLIDCKLEDITVCDPAVGSGAFLVGMMNEIVRLRRTLTPYFKDKTKRSAYDFKHHAIQSSLYGVDVDPGAVEIAKLRLWLSLVVEEDDIREIRALPNLDYKIMQGDSLVEEFEGVRLFDERLIEQPSLDLQTKKSALNARISELSQQFFELHGRGNRDKQTRRGIEKEIAKIKRELKVVDAPAIASPLPAQRDINDLFSEAQAKLPKLKELHDELFKAKLREQKKEIRTELSVLEWDIMQATVRDGIRELAYKLENLKHEFDNARRKGEPALILDRLKRKLDAMKAQKRERERAAEHLDELRDSSTKPFFLWRLHFLEVFQKKVGFDVVVGNPPYVRADSGAAHLATRRAIEQSGRFETLWERWDLYVAFIERGFKLLCPCGVISLIVSDAYCHSKYAQKSQSWFLKNSRILRLDFLSAIQVFEAAVRNVVFFFQRADGTSNRPERRVHGPQFGTVRLLPTAPQPELNYRAFFPESSNGYKVSVKTIPLSSICYVSFGCRPNSDEKTARGEFVVADLLSSKKDSKHPKSYIEAKDMTRWVYSQRRWLEWGTERSPSRLARPTFEELYEVPEKIVVADVSGAENRAAYDAKSVYHSHTLISIVPWHSLSGVKNNSLRKTARYLNEKLRPDLPRREDLEAVSQRFNVKYLLAVLNSSFARDFLRANRRSNIHLYPEDWKKIPIADVTESQQASIIRLVEQMLAAKKERALTDDDYEKSRLDQFCADLDREIDRLVYQLYELTDDEIAIVESRA